MAADRYDAPKREKHWQAAWERRGLFHASEEDPRPKYYVLEMFPYPSGRIHMGHVRNYTMGDVVARYMRAKGHNVLHPMGWDAFGLPAENAAIERGVHPAKWTYDNIAVMRGQLKSMGLSLDWSREFATCDLDYYHQQQRLFLAMRKAGLVDRKTRKVNWDPVDRTVLANEQVIDGRGWRSGALVEQREQPEWVFKITDYAQDLLQALEGLERWPEKVRLMQANWIGRSEGLLVRFEIVPGTAPKGHDLIEVFTTRPDTLFGASFVAIAPDHPLAKAVAERNSGARDFIAECQRHGTTAAELETQEKKGFDTGLRVRHPVIESAELPVLIANFIVMEYGTGAIFGCPAHDQRDLEFARAKGLPVIPVVLPADADAASFAIGKEAYTGDGVLINSGFLDGLGVEAAKTAIADALTLRTVKGKAVAERQTQYRLRDWGISRQRYWGCPIPMIHCRGLRHRTGAGGGSAGEASRRCKLRQAGQSARPASDLEACHLPKLRRPKPCARPTRWIRSSTRPGTSRGSARRTRACRPTLTPSATGCRSINISAASSTRSFISFTRASSPARCTRPVTSASTSRSRACSPKAW